MPSPRGDPASAAWEQTALARCATFSSTIRRQILCSASLSLLTLVCVLLVPEPRSDISDRLLTAKIRRRSRQKKVLSIPALPIIPNFFTVSSNRYSVSRMLDPRVPLASTVSLCLPWRHGLTNRRFALSSVFRRRLAGPLGTRRCGFDSLAQSSDSSNTSARGRTRPCGGRGRGDCAAAQVRPRRTHRLRPEQPRAARQRAGPRRVRSTALFLCASPPLSCA